MTETAETGKVYFVKKGNTFEVAKKEDMVLFERLPAGNYVLKQHPMFKYFYLDTVDDFSVPSRMYGTTERDTARILNTFLDRKCNTGVMLSGEKGSGKSLLAKNVSREAAKKGIPTILISEPWVGDEFNTWLQSIDQPVVVIFDEFEKVYHEKGDQEAVLSLFDGVFPGYKLFMLTCNDKFKIDVNMKNRPGRMYYMMEFGGLEEEFVREYCNDNIKNKDHINEVVTISQIFNQFNFDMLKAIIEEMNRYDEAPRDVIRMLNTKPEYQEKVEYNLIFTDSEKKRSCHQRKWRGNPLSDEIELYLAVKEPKKSNGGSGDSDPYLDDDSDDDYETFGIKDLDSMRDGSYKFVKGTWTVELVKKASDRFMLERLF